jgi:acetate kinase
VEGAGQETGRRGVQLIVLVVNPGGNSLKVQLVRCNRAQAHASEGVTLASVAVEAIATDPKFLVYEDKKIVRSDRVQAAGYAEALENILARLELQPGLRDFPLSTIDCVGVRVVHGGPNLTAPVEITPRVEQEISALERLAPLHNKSSVEVLTPLRRQFSHAPIFGVFDTAFHRTIPDYASTYAIPLDLSAKHQIHRYGFHGISHRYMLERYAHLVGKPVDQCSIVTMHLESGCSVSAIRKGKSIDNTMGLTPLEGLMMGTRSGDIDPSVVSLLMQEEAMSIEEVMTLFNKKSGLLGVSEISLDTRLLMPHYDTDPKVKLAMDMFCYRVLKSVGAYVAALGGAEAIVFGGGIAENNRLVRDVIGNGLRWCGLQIDRAANEKLIDLEGRLSTIDSPIQAWVIPAEEGLQIAHECSLCAPSC